MAAERDGGQSRLVEKRQRLELVDELFHAALERDPCQRAAFLAEACPEVTMRRKVESLLEADFRYENSLKTPDAQALGTHAQSSLVGRQLGAYRIVREIGRGGMGVVYEAVRVDGEYEQRVAIKLIARGPDSAFISHRLRKERQILANLNHPNIARLLDGGTTEDGQPYLVMEYVDGPPLDEYADAKCLSTAERLELFRTICNAVQYAHRNSVIHRDIKPTNIVIGEQGVPKLLDFGIAKVLQPEATVNSASQTTAVLLMTPEYSSPEQVCGEAITKSSDIYSLGVVLYRLLTGRLPFNLKSYRIDEVARVISTEKPIRPSAAIGSSTNDLFSFGLSPKQNVKFQTLRKQLRGDLDNIVLTALRKEPERRYQSVEEFSEDIRRHLCGSAVLARRDSITYRIRKFLNRNKRLVITGLLIAVACLIGGSYLSFNGVSIKTRSSVAVLPFINGLGDPNMDYLCDEITDNLQDRLSHTRGLTVPARNSVYVYKDTPIDPQSLKKDLDVESVLTGTVASDGGDLLVTVSLYDSSSGGLLFTKQYRAQSTDLQQFEREIADETRRELGWRPGKDGERQSHLINPEAYTLFLKGNYSLSQRTPESLAQAIDYYKTAIQIAPDYALAYSGLAATYSKRGTYLIVSPNESYVLARPMAEKAVALDRESAEAHSELGIIAWLYDWNWDLAEREFRTSIQLNPKNSLIHERFGLFLSEMNRLDEAIAEEQRAVQLDPLSALAMSDSAYVYYVARRYDEAREAIKTGRERLMGRWTFGNFTPTAILISEQTRDQQQLAELIYPGIELRRPFLKDGWKGYWRNQLDQTGNVNESWPGQRSYRKAQIFGRLGENDRAIKELEKAYKAHNHCMTGIKVDPAFDGLRADRRFQELLRRMNFAS